MKTNAIYVRCSTADQNYDYQVDKCQEWAKAHGLPNVQIYADKASGKDTNREAFQQLQADIFSGKVASVIVWKLDRLSRSLKDGINILSDWLEKNVRVVSVTQQHDLSGPTGQLIAAVLLSIAETERNLMRERTAEGIKRAKAQGKYAGRVKNSIKKKNGPKRAAELSAKGHSLREIANVLGVSHGTIRNYLARAKS